MTLHEFTLEFECDKETKNTFRFTAPKENDTKVVGSIYIPKETLKSKGVQKLDKITVTVSFGDD